MLEQVVYHSGRAMVDLYARLMLDMDVEWHAPLPAGPKIIVANHPTTTDPFYLLTLAQEQVSILITEMCFNVPVFGRYLRMAGHVPVYHNNGRAAFDEAVRLLEAGRTVAIFPEGSLSPREGGLGRPRTGAARLALVSGAPVVPVGIHLIRERIRYVDTTVEDLSETARWYASGPYAMTVGRPMVFDGDVENWAYVRAASERITRCIGQLALESARRLQASQALTTAPVLDTGRFASVGDA